MGGGIDIVNLISRVSEIWVLCRPSSTPLCVSLGKSRSPAWGGSGKATELLTIWNARTPWRKTSRLTYWAMLGCWNHKWHFFIHINKCVWICRHDVLVIQSFIYLTPTVYHRNSRAQRLQVGFEILTLTLAWCVTWGKLFNFSVPRFPHLQNEDNIKNYFKGGYKIWMR